MPAYKPQRTETPNEASVHDGFLKGETIGEVLVSSIYCAIELWAMRSLIGQHVFM